VVIINKKWLVPIIILAILFCAWGLRYEKGEEITQNNTKTVYYKDRWLGQQWYKYYATNDYYELPFINQSSINLLANRINVDEVSKVNNQIEQNKTQEAQLKEAAGSFQWYWSKYANEWAATMKPYMSRLDLAVQVTEGEFMMFRDEQFQNEILNSAQGKYIRNKMPKDLWDTGLAYNNNIREKYKLLNEQNVILTSNKNEAKTQLTSAAILHRKIATNSWFAVTGLATIWLISFFLIDKRKGIKNIGNTSSPEADDDAIKLE